MSEEREPEEGVRINDRRRIDPETFEARQPETPAAAAEPEPEVLAEDDPIALANARAEEATADAKRIAAEYANYRKRVDRDRDLQRDLAISTVVADLLPVLDDIERARSHDELGGGFKSVGEAVETVAAKYGLESYGEVGEAFDPTIHEAMTSDTSPEVTEPTVTAVYAVGYRLRGRILRAARVAVTDSE